MTEPNDPHASLPPQASGLITVLAAVVCRDGRYLICQRPAHKRHGGLWEFPGGKLEGAEKLEQAAERELMEELGVRVVAVGQPLMSIHDDGSIYSICFVPVEISGEPQPIEHDEIRWLTSTELLRVDLAPSDRRFTEEVLSPPNSRIAPPARGTRRLP